MYSMLRTALRELGERALYGSLRNPACGARGGGFSIALAIVIALVAASSATASELQAGAPSAASHDCACGSDCHGNCCCVKRNSPQTPRPSDEAALPDCVRSAPCQNRDTAPASMTPTGERVCPWLPGQVLTADAASEPLDPSRPIDVSNPPAPPRARPPRG